MPVGTCALVAYDCKCLHCVLHGVACLGYVLCVPLPVLKSNDIPWQPYRLQSYYRFSHGKVYIIHGKVSRPPTGPIYTAQLHMHTAAPTPLKHSLLVYI